MPHSTAQILAANHQSAEVAASSRGTKVACLRILATRVQLDKCVKAALRLFLTRVRIACSKSPW